MIGSVLSINPASLLGFAFIKCHEKHEYRNIDAIKDVWIMEVGIEVRWVE